MPTTSSLDGVRKRASNPAAVAVYLRELAAEARASGHLSRVEDLERLIVSYEAEAETGEARD